ncbi:MAG TPA: hypothetical protein VMY59_05435 [Candidatus Thermoplasmatota archaeon]|nr:hypothetical protein [Candidatus Thermoplasmatota archaeon]
MSGNTHYVVIGAENGDKACAIAEDIANDHNPDWIEVKGAISENGDVYKYVHGWDLEEFEGITVESIEQEILGYINAESSVESKALAYLWASNELLSEAQLRVLSEELDISYERAIRKGPQTFKDGLEYFPCKFYKDGVYNAWRENGNPLWVVCVYVHT